jgi:hypothetical protein
MFGGLPRFTIGNPKYPKGFESHGGPNGPDLPPLRYDGCLTKIMSTFLGIFVCMLTRYVPLGVYGLDFIPIMVWVGAVVELK